jgi:hypothetical protein
MPNENIKSISRTCKACLEYVGLKKVGCDVKLLRLTPSGVSAMPMNDKPFAGPVILVINQGGLQGSGLDVKDITLFREEVMPLLADNIPDVGLKFTGKIELIFRENTLQHFRVLPH